MERSRDPLAERPLPSLRHARHAAGTSRGRTYRAQLWPRGAPVHGHGALSGPAAARAGEEEKGCLRSRAGEGSSTRSSSSAAAGAMVQWVLVAVATVLFAILSPGLLLQIPGDQRPVELRNWRTSLASVLVHAVVFFVLLLALDAIFHFTDHR